MLKTDAANHSMATTDVTPQGLSGAHTGSRSIVGILIVAAAILLLHLFTNMRYGFHRDELQFLSDALHLDWGYVAYPSLTPFVERISIAIFGFSLQGLRLCSVFAQVAIVIVAGLIARTLGGSPLTQTTAALAAALSPIALFEGTEFQYTTFEQLAWVLAMYRVVRFLNDLHKLPSRRPRPISRPPQQRREQVPSGHLPLRAAAPSMAGLLAQVPAIRLTSFVPMHPQPHPLS